MWGFLKRKPREPIEITYMRAAGQLAPIVGQVNAEGRYVEFLILAPNDLPSPDDFFGDVDYYLFDARTARIR